MTAEVEIDELPKSGREPAICELRCPECADGIRFDQKSCDTCGWMNPRYAEAPKRATMALDRLREFHRANR